MAGVRAKRNHITKYMDTLPEEFETIEDNLDSEEPSIKLQTKTRIITLSCDESGRVIESFRMRRGAGSKDEFLAKQEAYTAIRTYYDNYYTGATIKQSSFDEGYIKIKLEEKIVTLTYDVTTKTVEEKDRARRGTKKQNTNIAESKETVIQTALPGQAAEIVTNQILVEEKDKELSEVDNKITELQVKQILTKQP